MKIKYVGPARDYSGYGEANRHDIAALNAAGVQITTTIPSYTLELSDYGPLGELATSFEEQPLGFNIIILHTTPNVYKKYMMPGKYHIGRVFWETDKLPLEFASNVELMDEIWTGSEFNKQAILNAGVTKPIFVIPEAIQIDTGEIKPYKVANEKDFKLYSIFEWTERKNPTALLEAFWLEFEKEKDVSLTIKTYIDNFTPQKKDEIDQLIKRIKRKLALSNYAPVYLFKNLMDRHQIYRFHKTFDCYVSTHRGEGWGIPQMEAMLMGNPIISTNCGGIHEYLRHKEDALLIPYNLIPLKGNNRNDQWYTTDQKWADVQVDDVRKSLRWVFDHQKEAKEMGIKARKTVKDLFSLEVVGEQMRERLEYIDNNIIYPVALPAITEE